MVLGTRPDGGRGGRCRARTPPNSAAPVRLPRTEHGCVLDGVSLPLLASAFVFGRRRGRLPKPGPYVSSCARSRRPAQRMKGLQYTHVHAACGPRRLHILGRPAPDSVERDARSHRQASPADTVAPHAPRAGPVAPATFRDPLFLELHELSHPQFATAHQMPIRPLTSADGWSPARRTCAPLQAHQASAKDHFRRRSRVRAYSRRKDEAGKCLAACAFYCRDVQVPRPSVLPLSANRSGTFPKRANPLIAARAAFPSAATP